MPRIAAARTRAATCPVIGAKSTIPTKWATGGLTDADKLTYACKPHHKLIERGWRTRKFANGRTEWIPPPQLDRGARTNDYHHPERMFDDDEATF